MSIKWSGDNIKKDGIDAIDNEKTVRGISFKTVFMILIIIAMLLFVIARALFSLKNSFEDKKLDHEEQMVIIDDLKVDPITKPISPISPISSEQTENQNLDHNYIDDNYNPSEKNRIVKGKRGLAEGQSREFSKQSKIDDVKINNSESDHSNGVVKAEILKLDPNLSIFRGTLIKCSLKTALISQISGDVSCILNDDVYSANGHVLLMEKGSMVNGAFRRAGVNHGDSRIFVLWEQIITPNYITININSGASDVLGASGIDGWVDNHFWTRFGNAILVSMITDVSSSASSRLQKENTYNDFSNTANSGSDVARTIIEKSVDIPPTIYRNHGDTVAIYISQNIDFSNVYKLEYRNVQ